MTLRSFVVNIEFLLRRRVVAFKIFGKTRKTMRTGELSLQEHLEKAWGGSYSC